MAPAACAAWPPWSTARIANCPMWLVGHTAEKEPSADTVPCAVGAQVQPVCLPRRSISTVRPAAAGPALPVNCSGLRSNAEARVAKVIPAPLALTVTLPGLTCADVGGIRRRTRRGTPGQGATAGRRQDEPREGQGDGTRGQKRCRVCSCTTTHHRPTRPLRLGLRGELTGSRLDGATVLSGTDSPLRPGGPQVVPPPTARGRTIARHWKSREYTKLRAKGYGRGSRETARRSARALTDSPISASSAAA